MSGLQVILEIVLVALLGATLFHALRLERALGVLKRDRATLEQLVSGFNGATRQAQQGIDRLQEAAEGAGRQIARQIETVGALKGDLQFLIERGDRLADRMDGLVRSGRASAERAPEPSGDRAFPAAEPPWAPPPELARALSAVREGSEEGRPRSAAAAEAAADAAPRMRSQAERDLLKALRMAR